MLAGKGIVRAGYGKGRRKGNVMSRLWIKKNFLIPPHLLTNFEIQKYSQNEPRFNLP